MGAKGQNSLLELLLKDSHIVHWVADVSHVTIYNFPIESNFQNIRAKVKFRLHEWETKVFDGKMGNTTKKYLKEKLLREPSEIGEFQQHVSIYQS